MIKVVNVRKWTTHFWRQQKKSGLKRNVFARKNYVYRKALVDIKNKTNH